MYCIIYTFYRTTVLKHFKWLAVWRLNLFNLYCVLKLFTQILFLAVACLWHSSSFLLKLTGLLTLGWTLCSVFHNMIRAFIPFEPLQSRSLSALLFHSSCMLTSPLALSMPLAPHPTSLLFLSLHLFSLLRSSPLPCPFPLPHSTLLKYQSCLLKV